jgi:hypothetical protein
LRRALFLVAALAALSTAPVAAADSTKTYTIPEGQTASTSPDATPADPIQLTIARSGPSTNGRNGMYRVKMTSTPATRIGESKDLVHAGPQFSITNVCADGTEWGATPTATCWPTPYTVTLVVDGSLIPEPGNRFLGKDMAEGKIPLANLCRSDADRRRACQSYYPFHNPSGRSGNLLAENLPNGDVRLYEPDAREYAKPRVIDFAYVAPTASLETSAEAPIGELLSGKHRTVWLACTLACRSTVTLSVSRSTANTFGLKSTTLAREEVDEAPQWKEAIRIPLNRGARRKLADANRVTVIVKLVAKSAGETFRDRTKVAFVRPPKPPKPPEDG